MMDYVLTVLNVDIMPSRLVESSIKQAIAGLGRQAAKSKNGSAEAWMADCAEVNLLITSDG